MNHNRGPKHLKQSGDGKICSYFWNHGLWFNKAKSGKPCNAKAPGYQYTETFVDMMGSSMKNIHT